jgi:pimeloyl-ACP methyl ester carboxylesterase
MFQFFRNIFIVALKLVGIAVLLVTTFGFLLYQNLSQLPEVDEYSTQTPANFTVSEDSWPNVDVSSYLMDDYETVRFESKEPGIFLAGWHIKSSKNSRVVIVVPGFKSSKGSEKTLIIAGILFRNGFDVFLLDTRDQGESDVEDLKTALGTEEYLDVLGAWEMLRDEKGYKEESIGLMGGSLGGVTALISFLKETRISAVFLDSPFSDHLTVIQEELKMKGYPSWLAYAGIMWAPILSQDDLLSVSLLGELAQTRKRPIFLTHATGDPRIGFHHSEALFQVALDNDLPVTTWWTEGDHHVKGMFAYPELYESKLITFFNKSLGGSL